MKLINKVWLGLGIMWSLLGVVGTVNSIPYAGLMIGFGMYIVFNELDKNN